MNCIDSKSLSKHSIQDKIIQVINEILEELEVDSYQGTCPATRFIEDLDLDSIHIVRIFTAINESFKLYDISYHELIFPDGEFKDVSIQEVTDFIYSCFV